MVAARIIAILDARDEPWAGLVTAAQLARVLGVDRGTVYEHAEHLGAIRVGEIGEGRRPRLRFDVERALAAWSVRSADRQSQNPRRTVESGKRRGRPRVPLGASGDLLPIRRPETS
jgi:hypothetical protein